MAQSEPGDLTPREGDAESQNPDTPSGDAEREDGWPSSLWRRVGRLEHASTTHGARIAEHRQWQRDTTAKLDGWHRDIVATLAEVDNRARNAAAHSGETAGKLDRFAAAVEAVGRLQRAVERMGETVREHDRVAGLPADVLQRLTNLERERLLPTPAWCDAVTGKLAALTERVESWDPIDEWGPAVDDRLAALERRVAFAWEAIQVHGDAIQNERDHRDGVKRSIDGMSKSVAKHAERLHRIESAAGKRAPDSERIAALERTVDAAGDDAGPVPDADARPATVEARLPNGRTVTLPTGPAPGSAPVRADADALTRNRMRVEGARRYLKTMIREYERSAPHHPGTSAGALRDLERVAELLDGVDL